ncbi:hypothetical protein PCE1_001251 [Barthelona sp. PCE]
MKFVGVLLCLLIVASASVVTLDEKSFEETMAAQEFALVKFYAPWCTHCKALAEPFTKAAETLESYKHKMILAEVDCDDHGELCQKFEVKGYPTVKLFRNGAIFMDYEGGRTEQDIIAFMDRFNKPVAKQIKKEEIETIENLPFTVFYLKEESLFTDISNEVGLKISEMDLYVVTITEGDEKVVVHKNDEEEPISELVLSEDDSTTTIMEFIGANRLGLVIELNQNTFRSIFVQDSPLIFMMFHDPATDSLDEFMVASRALAKEKGRGIATFTTVDGVMFSRFMERLGLPSLPGVVALDIGKDNVFIKKDEELLQWMNDALDNKLDANVRSQDEPEELRDENGVITVVGTSWEKVMEGEFLEKTRVLMVHAPWCSHCQEFKPIYNKVAQDFANAELLAEFELEKDDIVLAMLDGDGNDIPSPHVQITSFPTIFVFPKGSVEPIAYPEDKDRTEIDVIEYALQNHKGSEDWDDEAFHRALHKTLPAMFTEESAEVEVEDLA